MNNKTYPMNAFKTIIFVEMYFLSIEVFRMYIMGRNNRIKHICKKYVLKFATFFLTKHSIISNQIKVVFEIKLLIILD